MATDWTDEKHRLYLDSMEASFIKQLYNNEYCPNDTLGWLSRAQMQTNSPASESSDVKSRPFGQLKVFRSGCWENLQSERVSSQYTNENESHKKSTNPWGQHFRSPSTAKAPHLTSSAQMSEDDLVNQSVDLINRMHGSEATSSEKPSLSYSRKVHRVSIGSLTEVSDQNFLDIDIERGEELSGRRSAKRARSAASPITDQVVPFVLPTSEKIALLNENNEEDRKGDVESTADSLQTASQVSPRTDQQPNDPKLRGSVNQIGRSWR